MMLRALNKRWMLGSAGWRPKPCKPCQTSRAPGQPCILGSQVHTSRKKWAPAAHNWRGSKSICRTPTPCPWMAIRSHTQVSAAQADTASGPPQDSVLLLGFTPEDLHVIHHHMESLFPEMSPDLIGVVTQPLSQHTVSHLITNIELTLEHAAQEDPASSSTSSGPSVHQPVLSGRVVYLVSGAAAYARDLNDVLVSIGVAPAIVGAMQPKHASQRMCDVVDALRAAHARYWELVRPVQLVDTLDHLMHTYQHAVSRTGPPAAAGSTTQQAANDAARASEDQEDAHVLGPLASSRLVVSAVLDAGEVPCSTGGWRRDEAHMVVLDGLLTEAERQSLLDWVTAPGHDHGGAPPEDKWEQSCVDREGDAASWGLRPHVLAALEESPPPEVVALQTRLAALYPEYTLCHMPADVISNPDEEDVSLTAFVGNAIMQGDPCAWHDDADPAILPPSSPWVHCYGYYYNREPGKPRFVSLLLYLNESWPEELHAETMFLDPTAQAGLFVRPTPGRVVLMDQDMPHRICAPSQAAGPAPRYSLVWKMVWLPKHDPTLPGAVPVDSSSASREPGLCRHEWGAPIRLGSAGELLGKAAWGSNS